MVYVAERVIVDPKQLDYENEKNENIEEERNKTLNSWIIENEKNEKNAEERNKTQKSKRTHQQTCNINLNLQTYTRK